MAGTHLRQYEQLLDRAGFATEQDAVIKSETVYYSVRDPMERAVRVAEAASGESAGRKFWGRLRRGQCVDADNLEASRPKGLVGRTIRYVCDEEPRPSELYARSKVHRGHRGLLRGNVQCKVLVPFVVSR